MKAQEQVGLRVLFTDRLQRSNTISTLKNYREYGDLMMVVELPGTVGN